MNLNIRYIANHMDMAACTIVDETAFDTENRWTISDLMACTDEKHYGVIATIDKHIAGYAILKETKNGFKIKRIAVQRQLWRLGVGSCIMTFIGMVIKGHKLFITIKPEDLVMQLFLKENRGRCVSHNDSRYCFVVEPKQCFNPPDAA